MSHDTFDSLECPRCSGTGTIGRRASGGYDTDGMPRRIDADECPRCDGTGEAAWVRAVREIATQLAAAPDRVMRTAREHVGPGSVPGADKAHAFGGLHSASRHAARRLLRLIDEDLPEDNADAGDETRPTIPCPPPMPESGTTLARAS